MAARLPGNALRSDEEATVEKTAARSGVAGDGKTGSGEAAVANGDSAGPDSGGLDFGKLDSGELDSAMAACPAGEGAAGRTHSGRTRAGDADGGEDGVEDIGTGRADTRRQWLLLSFGLSFVTRPCSPMPCSMTVESCCPSMGSAVRVTRSRGDGAAS